MTLVLASASPRRQELLRGAGIGFTVSPADIPEIPQAFEKPRDFAERLAREKALAAFSRQPEHFVLGADTVVVADQQMLGKPRDVDDAKRMLHLLSGRTHEVITGVCLVCPQVRPEEPGCIETQSETTLVCMQRISEDDICYYIGTGEPMDKAGAYAIQGIAGRWIPRIEGDYSNVVGLPVARVYRMLQGAGAL
jgi:septum formation protein